MNQTKKFSSWYVYVFLIDFVYFDFVSEKDPKLNYSFIYSLFIYCY